MKIAMRNEHMRLTVQDRALLVTLMLNARKSDLSIRERLPSAELADVVAERFEAQVCGEER